VTHCDAYVLLFLGWARAGLVHVSVNDNARTDELAHLATRPEPATVFHVTLLAEHVAAALTHPRHPSAARLRRWNRRRARMALQRRRPASPGIRPRR